MEDLVNVYTRKNQLVAIRKKDLDTALSKGFRLAEEPKPEEPKPEDDSFIKSAVDTVSDVSRGAARGITFGGLEEAVAGAEALGTTALGKIKGEETEDLASLYRKYLDIEEQKTKEMKERSPYLSGGAELLGSIIPTALTGGAAIGGSLAATGVKSIAQLGGKELLKAVGKSALVGAAEGAAQSALDSEGKLIGATEEEQKKLAQDVAIGGLLGGVAGGLVPAASKYGTKALESAGKKLKDVVPDTYLTPQIKAAFELGKKGKGLFARSQTEALEKEIGTAKSKIVNFFNKTEDKAYEMVSDILDSLSKSGVKISPTSKPEEIQSVLNTLVPSGRQNIQTIELLNKLKTNLSLDPMDADVLRKNLNDLGYKGIADSLKKELSKASPDYADTLRFWSDVRNTFKESLVTKGMPLESRETKISQLTKSKEAIKNAVDELVDKYQLPGGIGRDARQTMASEEGGIVPLFRNLQQGGEANKKKLNEFSERMGFNNPDELIKKFTSDVDELATESATLKFAQGSRPEGEGLDVPSLSSWVTSRKPLLIGTNILGQASETAAAKGIKGAAKAVSKVYNLPESSLRKLSSSLMTSKNLSNYGKSLNAALDSGDVVKRNAALFALSQHPSFREMVKDYFPEEEKPEGE
jgi:hypothetical protein